MIANLYKYEILRRISYADWAGHHQPRVFLQRPREGSVRPALLPIPTIKSALSEGLSGRVPFK